MRHISTIIVLFVMFLSTGPSLFGQTTQPAVTDPDPLVAITKLREELLDSFNKGDVERLLAHLDDDVVVTWQDAEVCRGRAGVKAYYDKMMTGPDRIVKSVHANSQVTDRHVYDGTWAVSWGKMNDEFLLEDGSNFKLDSKFTATIARRGDVWKVTSFHASVNAFDNAILTHAIKRTLAWSITCGLGIGAVVGVLAAKALRRKAA